LELFRISIFGFRIFGFDDDCSRCTPSGNPDGLLFALVALGLTIIFGMMDIVNFAHGEFLMIGMYTTYWTSLLLHMDPLITLPASAIVGMLLGLASYYWLVKYLLRGPMIAQLSGPLD